MGYERLAIFGGEGRVLVRENEGLFGLEDLYAEVDKMDSDRSGGPDVRFGDKNM